MPKTILLLFACKSYLLKQCYAHISIRHTNICREMFLFPYHIFSCHENFNCSLQTALISENLLVKFRSPFSSLEQQSLSICVCVFVCWCVSLSIAINRFIINANWCKRIKSNDKSAMRKHSKIVLYALFVFLADLYIINYYLCFWYGFGKGNGKWTVLVGSQR